MHWSAGTISLGMLVLIPGGSYAPASALWLAKANPWGFVVTALVGVSLIAVGLSGVLHDVGHRRDEYVDVFGESVDSDLEEMCDPFSPNPLRRCVVEF